MVDISPVTDLEQRCRHDVFKETLESLQEAIGRQANLLVSLVSMRLSDRLLMERYNTDIEPPLMTKWAADSIRHASELATTEAEVELRHSGTAQMWNLNEDPREVNGGGKPRAAFTDSRGNLPGLPPIKREAGVSHARKRRRGTRNEGDCMMASVTSFFSKTNDPVNDLYEQFDKLTIRIDEFFRQAEAITNRRLYFALAYVPDNCSRRT